MLFGLYVRRSEVDAIRRTHLRTVGELIRERNAAQRYARELRLQLTTRYQFEASMLEEKFRDQNGIPRADLEAGG